MSEVESEGLALGNYRNIPIRLLRSKDFTHREKLALCIILDLAELKLGCIISNAGLAEEIGITTDAAADVVRCLKDKGVISSKVERDEKKRVVKRQITVNREKLNTSLEKTQYLPGKNSIPSPGKTQYLPRKNSEVIDQSNRSDIEDQNSEASPPPHPLLEHFTQLTTEIESHSLYTSLYRRPLKKYPDIWLTPEELDEALKAIKTCGVSAEAVFKKVQEKFNQEKVTGRRVQLEKAKIWLEGWAFTEEVNQAKEKLFLRKAKGEPTATPKRPQEFIPTWKREVA